MRWTRQTRRRGPVESRIPAGLRAGPPGGARPAGRRPPDTARRRTQRRPGGDTAPSRPSARDDRATELGLEQEREGDMRKISYWNGIRLKFDILSGSLASVGNNLHKEVGDLM